MSWISCIFWEILHKSAKLLGVRQSWPGLAQSGLNRYDSAGTDRLYQFFKTGEVPLHRRRKRAEEIYTDATLTATA